MHIVLLEGILGGQKKIVKFLFDFCRFLSSSEGSYAQFFQSTQVRTKFKVFVYDSGGGGCQVFEVRFFGATLQ